MIANADFETRSGADIRDGLDAYFGDPEADALCLAYSLPGDERPRLWVAGQPGPRDLFGHIVPGGLVSGWNVGFEYRAWNEVMVPKHGWPPLPLEQLVDTMAMAAAMNLPQGLGDCAKALGLPEDQQKAHHGKVLIRRLCVPRRPSKHNPSRWNNDPEDLQALYDYCRQDVVTEMAVAARLRPLSEFEQRVWVETQKMNLRGLPIDVDEVRRILSVVEREKVRLNGELEALTGGAITSATDRAGLLRWVNDRLPGPLPDLQAETLEQTLEHPPEGAPADVLRALQLRLHCCQTSTAKFEKMLEITAPDGRIRGLLSYHGAGTGRWASRGGLNAQNFPRPKVKQIDMAHQVLGSGDHELAVLLWGDQTMDAAVSCLRGVIKAPAGYRFIDADYSSVENRVSAWLAGQDDKLDLFRKGLDEYKTFASGALYEIPYDRVTKDQRQVAKSAVLGCMFGQGAIGLINYAEGYGVTLTQERSKEIVDKYRAEYPKVQSLWYELGDVSIKAVKTPGAMFEAGDKLRMWVEDGFLWLALPSGRRLAWYDPKVEMKPTPWGEDRNVVTVMAVNSVTKQWCRDKLIGSAIFQNAVQGIARDIIAQGLLNVVDAGYDPVLLAHDEALALVPDGQGDPDDFGQRLCSPADWYADLPLNYEAWEGPRFQK